MFALLSLLSLRQQGYVHPVAAADYFCVTSGWAGFRINILNIVPVTRKGGEGKRWRCEQAAGCDK